MTDLLWGETRTHSALRGNGTGGVFLHLRRARRGVRDESGWGDAGGGRVLYWLQIVLVHIHGKTPLDVFQDQHHAATVLLANDHAFPTGHGSASNARPLPHDQQWMGLSVPLLDAASQGIDGFFGQWRWAVDSFQDGTGGYAPTAIPGSRGPRFFHSMAGERVKWRLPLQSKARRIPPCAESIWTPMPPPLCCRR